MKLFNSPSLFLALALVTCAYSRLNIPNDVNIPSIRDDLAPKNLAPRVDFYDQAVERGQAFLAQFNSNRYSAPMTGGTVADSGFQGWRISSVPPPTGSTPDATLGVVLQGLVGSPRNKYHEWRATYNLHNHRANYRNLYGPEDGVIVGLFNGSDGVSIPMSNWSEITWRIWADICDSVSIDPKTLKYIIRHNIANSQTLAIIDEIYHFGFPNETLGDQIILLPSGRTLQGFQALLGSPNGRGVAWMLLNKRNVLGKTIAKITVEKVNKDTWDMWFELQEIVVAPSSATIL